MPGKLGGLAWAPLFCPQLLPSRGPNSVIVLQYWVCHKLNGLSCEIYTCLEGWCPCVTSGLIAILRLGFSGSEFVAPLPASSRCCFAVVMRALEPVCSFHLMPLRAEAWVLAPAFCDGEFREGSVTPGKSGRVCTWRRGDSSGGQAVWRGSLRMAPDGLSFSLSPGMCTFQWVGPSTACWGHCFPLQ